MKAKGIKAEITGAGKTVRFLPNEYRECADEDGVIRKYKVPVHEPSFKTGIKEVVEWVEENKFGLRSMDNYCDFGIDTKDWQAKLKEWGIT